MSDRVINLGDGYTIMVRHAPPSWDWEGFYPPRYEATLYYAHNCIRCVGIREGLNEAQRLQSVVNQLLRKRDHHKKRMGIVDAVIASAIDGIESEPQP